MITGKPTGRLYFARTDDSGAVRMDEVNEISAEMDTLSADGSIRVDLTLKTASATFDIELDKPLPPVELARIMGMQVTIVPKPFMCIEMRVEPVRRHRKWRIHKKWLKRYGVKVVFSKEEKEPFIVHGETGDVLMVGPDTWKKIKDGFTETRVFNLSDYWGGM